MTTDNELAPWETLPPVVQPRYLVQVPVGTLSKVLYDGGDERAALKIFYDAQRLNQLPLFAEVRQVVIV